MLDNKLLYTYIDYHFVGDDGKNGDQYKAFRNISAKNNTS